MGELSNCHERVCLCVYMCFGTTPYFLCVLPMAVARSCSGGVVILYVLAGFIDDVMFAHKPRLLDVAAKLKRSARAALGLAISCAQ